MMRLSTFIAENSEQILSEWVEFAHGLPGCETMDVDALRDHAKEMLVVIQQDLETPQSNRDQADKSKGRSDASGRRLNPAQEHGAGRAESGFTIGQMLAEFRALRATVIRLWTKAQPQYGVEELEDLTRFNEAIDQAVAESVSLYTQSIDRSKEMFLAILGHDLRSPLGAVLTSAQFMLDNVSLAEPSRTLTTRIASSAKRMNDMIGDLLDFTRGRFGDGMPIDRSNIDLSKVCRAVVDEVSASHADRTIALETIGDLRDRLDGDRVAQALANLVNNALHHGSPTSLVLVRATGKPDELVISVHNTGPVIPRDQVKRIFGAMTHVPTSGQRDRRHLGLGLYIVEQIVTGHRGTVTVESTARNGTTFTMHLPRASRTTQGSRAGEKPALALV